MKTFDVTIRIQAEDGTNTPAESIITTLIQNHLNDMLDCPQVLAVGWISIKESKYAAIPEVPRYETPIQRATRYLDPPDEESEMERARR